MRRGRPEGSGAGPLGVAAGLATLLVAGSLVPSLAIGAPAVDEPASDPSGGTRWSVGLLAGSTQFDTELADYQWDTRPRVGWGVEGLVGRGRLALGLRLWTAATHQSIGDLGEAPQVRATTVELVGEARVAQWRGLGLIARAAAGRLRLGYQPDQVTIQPSGVGPIVVDLAPVDTWIAGGGLAVRQSLAARWTLGLGADHRVFAIDTAHRSGDVIVLERESFGDWSMRFELAREFGR